ncbi:MAG TPA: hypothetical protein VGK10_08685 [Prolixibacteraceae bacterium]|jgi:hypothetical protein
MKQNKYFSLGRFAQLLRNDWLINQKSYLYTLVGMSIVVYAITYLSMIRPVNFPFTNYIPLFIFYMLGIGAIIGSAFPVLKDHIKTTNYLMLPGSMFEKFMVQIFVRMVLLIPLSLFIFWIGVHLAKVTAVHEGQMIADFTFSELFGHIIKLRDQFLIIVSIFSMATLLFAGSVYFNRFSLVKTSIVFFLMIGIVVLTFVLFSHLFYPAETHGFHIQLQNYKITEDLYNTQLAGYLLGALSWLFFLPLAYFKLKEKEV